MIVGDVKLDNRNHIKSLFFLSNEKIYFLSNKNFYQKIDIYSKIIKNVGLTEQLFGNDAERFKSICKNYSMFSNRSILKTLLIEKSD